MPRQTRFFSDLYLVPYSDLSLDLTQFVSSVCMVQIGIWIVLRHCESKLDTNWVFASLARNTPQSVSLNFLSGSEDLTHKVLLFYVSLVYCFSDH